MNHRANEIQKAFSITEGLDNERAEWESYQGAKGLYGNAVYRMGAPGGIAAIGYSNGSGWLRTVDGETITFPIRNVPSYFLTEMEFVAAIDGKTWEPAIPVAPAFVPLVREGRVVIIDNPHANSGIIGVEKNGEVLFHPSKNGIEWNNKNLWWRSRLVRDGITISMGWPKFHNLDEKPEVLAQLNKLLAKGGKITAYEKLDGTLLIRSECDGAVRLRTRGSHTIGGLEDKDEDYEDFGQVNLQEINSIAAEMGLLEPGIVPDTVCLLFEYVSPNNKIIIGYDRPSIILIGAVDHASEILITPDDAIRMANRDWPFVARREISGKNVKEAVLSEFGKSEGAVIWHDGWIYKSKTDDYLCRFKARFMLNEKFVITAAIKKNIYEPARLLEDLSLPEECLGDVTEWLEQLRSCSMAILEEFRQAREFARKTDAVGQELKNIATEKFGDLYHMCFAEKKGTALRFIASALAKRLNLKMSGDPDTLSKMEYYLATIEKDSK